MEVSNAFLISLVQTIVLTVVSVFRKYTIRTKFKKAEDNLMKSQDSDELTIDIDHLDLAQKISRIVCTIHMGQGSSPSWYSM